MTDIEKAEQAWVDRAIRSANPLSFSAGMIAIKSSLQREIEKRIEELQKRDSPVDYWGYTKRRIDENKKFLELLNTVEP